MSTDPAIVEKPAKTTYRAYSDEDRARGLAALQAVGGRVQLAAIATGFPKSTLERWRESERVTSVQRVNPQLRLKEEAKLERGFERTALRYLGHLETMPLEKTGAKDAAIVAGIAHTHLRLLRSQPTSISETRDLASFLSAAYGKRTDVVDVTPSTVKALDSKGNASQE